ncbi:MAG: sensor domain-containing phosphodiesterase [Actinobacteria bacterium]|nr:sensor domain-containing phosphodiesterase [Actinomycetota bacterium]
MSVHGGNRGPDPDDRNPLVTSSGLRAVLAHVDEPVICCDEFGTVRFVNDAFRTLLGYAPELFVGRNIVEIVHPDQIDDAVQAIARWEGRTGTPRGEPVRVKAADGSWTEVRYDAVLGQDFGEIGSLIVTLRPESSVEFAERELRARALNDDRIIRMSTVFLNLPTDDFDRGIETVVSELGSLEDVTRVSVWRAKGDRIVRRAAWEARIGAPRVELDPRIRISDFASLRRASEGKDTLLSEPWHHGPEFERERTMFLAAETTNCLICPMIGGDEFVGIIMVESTLNQEFGATHLSATRSASAILAEAFLRNEIEQRLATQALTDRVTGMSNRWAFDVELECALDDLSEGQLDGVALAIVDLDRFKTVNDAYGHGVGDRVLLEIAQRFRSRTTPGTTLARLGGDEILILLAGVAGPDEAVRNIETLLRSLDVPFELPGAAVALTASAGVAFTSDPDCEVGELMGKADVAMYHVKSEGGDGVALADPDAHRDRSARLRLESELHDAIDADRILVHYQPEYDLATGKLLGAEALARWMHPRRGLLTASEFVPLVEGGNYISMLGRQVLHRACRTAATWCGRANPEPFLLRVNVSSRQLRQADFVDQVADVLADTGYPAESLCLELTESMLLTDPLMAAERFSQLRELGVGLAIDDFGTGYSSYLQLRSLPLTALKIDRSFVTELPESHTDSAIVVATLDLAAALGLTVTAEGVETEVQRDALVRLGCHAAQGFLLGRPMSAEHFVELFGTAA